MSPKSTDVDDYIATSPEFARPILEKIRRAAHKACPEMEEAIKWRAPTFLHQGMVGSMSAFKAHVGLGFWKSKLMSDPAKLFVAVDQSAIHLARIESIDDLPSEKLLVQYFKEAVQLNVEGVSAKKPRKRSSMEGTTPPEDFLLALKTKKVAITNFENFSPSKKREYIEWILDARKPETRATRIQTALEWISEGKSRNWKYETC